MSDSEYQSVERVLLLLRYLMQAEQGVTRSDIYRDIKAYQQASTESAQRRMFERDIRQLEQVGFCVIRERRGLDASNLNNRGARHATYRVIRTASVAGSFC